MINKKGQTNGLITGLVFGVASLVIITIIAFLIVSTLINAGLFDGARSTGIVTNETDVTLNDTLGYQLDGFPTTLTNFINPVITLVMNETHVVIPSTQYQVNATGWFTNSTVNATMLAGVDQIYNVSYTYSIRSSEETSSNFMSGNFTSGVNNISEQLPTVLLVAAIVLILGVLAILVGVWQRMRVGSNDL